MSGKIIFSDLDGTLLTTDKKISNKDRIAIERAVADGNKFVIATGRHFESARNIARQLNLDRPGCFIVSYNGGHIFDCKKQQAILDKKLDMEVVKELFDRVKKAGLYIHTYEGKDIVTEKPTKELEWYMKKTGMGSRTGDVFSILKSAPNKCIIIDIESKARLDKFKSDNLEWSKDKFDFIFTCPEYLEEMPLGVNKGSAIEFLADYLKVDLADTIGVGDEENDVDMIKKAGIGVAMINGIDKAKAVADYVTKNNNDNNAMSEIIEKFVL